MEKMAPQSIIGREFTLPELIQADLWRNGQFQGACGLKMTPRAGGRAPRWEAQAHVESCPECRKAVENPDESVQEAVKAFEIVGASSP